MSRYVWAYAAALLAMAVVDGLWLGFVARDFYKSQMGALMAPKPAVAPAILFYLLYPAGLVFFVVMPSLREQSLTAALLAGAFFGLVAYATYDMSNLAATAGWPPALAIVDMIWGAVLTAIVCGAAHFAAAKFA